MEREIKPLVVFGAIIIGFTLFSAFFFFSSTSPAYFFNFYEARSHSALYFLIGIHLFYLLTGIGVILRARWGYFLFKLFLYLTILAFPIGTIISYYTLSYMRRHRLEQYFGIS